MTATEPTIHTSDADYGDVQISLDHLRVSDSNEMVRLAITDKRSGQVLAQVDLTAKQFTQMVGSTVITVSGAILPVHPERIGRREQNTSMDITYRSAGNNLDAAAEAARDAYLAAGWEHVRITRTNYGRRVTANRWIDDDDDEAVKS
jgi:hypothetical protein